MTWTPLAIFQIVCKLCAISVIILKWVDSKKVTEFLQRHKVFSIVYVVLVTLGFVFVFININ